ncbi:uncharacterized protein BJ212DRAFT_1304435 [Suillus subaureus]|uniref:Uncharacterized protein n=1 Tax=Suillus subaureus TaxID=48587 RepID=A0A9P7J5V9_9AGAM|nr:uncharacterized protein BJ212DRAFT_1304435 [Suillus subaureus]KAG1804136.1 hypothetical protein BJ212DRAFT_1304435 [Suillus subaureus]
MIEQIEQSGSSTEIEVQDCERVMMELDLYKVKTMTTMTRGHMAGCLNTVNSLVSVKFQAIFKMMAKSKTEGTSSVGEVLPPNCSVIAARWNQHVHHSAKLGQIPGVNPSTMQGLDHEDKVMQKALDFKLPEMGLKGCIIRDEDFDVFFGKHSQEEEDSCALVEKVLVDKELFQPNDPSQFNVKRPETHPGKWTNTPDLHQKTPPNSNTARVPTNKYEFMSCANNAIGGSRKLDIVLTSKVKKGNDFGQVQAVIEVKYTSSTSHYKDALFIFINKSWFMLDDCDQQVHTISGALCGSILCYKLG